MKEDDDNESDLLPLQAEALSQVMYKGFTLAVKGSLVVMVVARRRPT
jgi:hypothetical protein